MAQSFADNPANPELQAIREQQRSMLKDAVETAIAALPIHDRTVLRMSIVDNLPIDDIGRAFDVHRATAARWLERIRVELRTATMRALRSALASPQHEAELTSICRALDSQLAISFPRLLAS
jgi:RNA polymerase sigma-70 factor (ECF subfamily)